MQKATLATGNKTVAKKLINFTRKFRKQYGISVSEAIEMAMKEPIIWKKYKQII